MNSLNKILTSKKFLKDRLDVLELKNQKNHEAVTRRYALLGIQALALSSTTFSALYSQNNKVLFISLSVLNALCMFSGACSLSKLSNTIQTNNNSIEFLKEEIDNCDNELSEIIESSDDIESELLVSNNRARV